jgi:hypothetical protein
VLKGLFGASSAIGKSTVTEAQLDSPIATYTYGGKAGTITVRQAIEQTSSLEIAKASDGGYTVPSAESVVSVVRNQIILADADSRGIKVSDTELADYAKNQLGSSDFASIGSNYGMSEDAVKELLRQSCLMNKLRETIAGETEQVTMPDAPPTAGSRQRTRHIKSSRKRFMAYFPFVGDRHIILAPLRDCQIRGERNRIKTTNAGCGALVVGWGKGYWGNMFQ